jgi:hypothetical protein
LTNFLNCNYITTYFVFVLQKNLAGKSIFIFLIFSAPSAFTQLAVEFPEYLISDPYDHNIARLEFKEVIQYRKWDAAKPDSSGGILIEFSMQYTLVYNSLQNISSYKFDFRTRFHWQYLSASKPPTNLPKPIKGSTNYYFYNHNDSLYALPF